MHLTLPQTDAPAPNGRVGQAAAPVAPARLPGGAPAPRRSTVVPEPLRLLPRDREEIARREARVRRRRLLLNAAVGVVLLMLTAIGIRYETRPPSADRMPAAVMGR